MKDEINYFEQYENGQIGLMDIPLSHINSELLLTAFRKQDDDFDTFISELYVVNKQFVQRMARDFYYSCSLSKYEEYFLSKSIYEILFNIDRLNNFPLIPEEFQTEAMFGKLSQEELEILFSSMRYGYSRAMCKKVFEINPEKYFEKIPDYGKTAEMCKKVFEINPEKYFEKIPDELKTVEMYKTVLRSNFMYYSQFVPEGIIDVEIIGIAKIEIDKMIADKKNVGKNDLSKLMSVVISLYPDCGKVITENRIKDELYLLISKGGSIDWIANKYNVSITVVNGILESLKEEDAASYERIKGVLESNQRTYFFQRMKDANNLSVIIDYLGNIDFKGISLEQKLKFSYLCNKYLTCDLEEIYGFGYDKYSSKDYSNIKKFFNRVLKYNFINSDYTTIPEKKTIKFNNSWFRNYNTERFFAIKDGQPTIERRYGKNSELLTLEIEDKIVNALKFEGIPLTEVLVTTAFKEYFNGNLSGYIEKVNGFSTEFEQFKSKKVSSEDDKGTKK